MRAAEILLEYDRARAAQAVGPNLWKSMIREILNLNISLKDFEKEWEEKYPAAFNQYKSVITDQKSQDSLVNNALEKLEQADPTTNKKYSQWLARMFASDPRTKLEDMLSTVADFLNRFNILSRKKLLKPEHQDINRIKTINGFLDIVAQYAVPEEDTDKGQADKIYSDSSVTVIVPKDEAAACAYGRQTRWCTAATRGINYFDHYNQQGTLYILIPKEPAYKGEKYQLHFQSQQFMNENDDQTSIGWLLKTRFPQLKELFMKVEPKGMSALLEFTPPDIIEQLVNDIAEILMEEVNEIEGEIEQSDDGYARWLQDNYADENGDIEWSNAPSYFDYDPDAGSDYNQAVKTIKPTYKELLQAVKYYIDDNPDEQLTVGDLEKVLDYHIGENAPEIYSRRLRNSLNKDVVIHNPGKVWKVSRLARH